VGKDARLRSGRYREKKNISRYKVEGALVVQQFEVADDVGFDFVGIGLGVELLQFGDELGNGVVAVTALHNFEAGSAEPEGAFGHEQDALPLIFAETNAGSELGFGVGIDGHDELTGDSLQLTAAQKKATRIDFAGERMEKPQGSIFNRLSYSQVSVAVLTLGVLNWAFLQFALLPGTREDERRQLYAGWLSTPYSYPLALGLSGFAFWFAFGYRGACSTHGRRIAAFGMGLAALAGMLLIFVARMT
jgi:hypothetical protein